MLNLSDKEWQVLDALWESEGTELGVLVEILHPKTGWNVKTVHTYLTRMAGKGLVNIDKKSSPYIYEAAISRECCQEKERKHFLNIVYKGETVDLIVTLLKEEAVSKEERIKLRKLFDEMEI